MKKLFPVYLAGLIFLANSPASAEVFGDSDDRYFGFQMTIPLEMDRAGLFASKAEYSAVMIDQHNGIKEGVSLTWDANGVQTIGYLSPSADFKIGRSRVSDFSIPVYRLNGNAGIHGNYNSRNDFLYLAIGAVAFLKLVDYATDEIVDCVTKEFDDCDDSE